MINSYDKYGDKAILEALVSGDVFDFVDSYVTLVKNDLNFKSVNWPNFVSKLSTDWNQFFDRGTIIPSYTGNISIGFGGDVYAPLVSSLSRRITGVSYPSDLIRINTSDYSFTNDVSSIKATYFNIRNSNFTDPISRYTLSTANEVISAVNLNQILGWSNTLTKVVSFYPVGFSNVCAPNLVCSISNVKYARFDNFNSLSSCGLTSIYINRVNATTIYTLGTSPNLTSVFIWSSSVISLGSATALDNTPLLTSGHVYVPSDLLSQYLAATNWSSLPEGVVTSINDSFNLIETLGYLWGTPALPTGVFVTGLSGVSLPLENPPMSFTSLNTSLLTSDTLSGTEDSILYRTTISGLSLTGIIPSVNKNIKCFGISANYYVDLSSATGYFSGCSSLETVFFSWQNASYLDIPVIPDDFFRDCTSLKLVGTCSGFNSEHYVFYSVKSIGANAFNNCGSLKFVPVGKTVGALKVLTSIGSQAFRECASLQDAFFPFTTYVGAGAFSSCSSLWYAEFAELTSVLNYTFAYCTSLRYINCPKATSFGDNAFQNCSSLTKFDWDDVVEYQVTSIGNNCFSGCTALTRVNFPNLKLLGYGAFRNCYSLTNIDLSHITTILSETFYGCSSLSRVESLSVTEVDYTALKGTNLEKIRLPRLTNSQAQINSLYIQNIDFPLLSNGEFVVSYSNSIVSSIADIKVPLLTRGFQLYGYTASSIWLPSMISSADTSLLGYCSNLASLTMPRLKNMGGNNSYFITSCNALTSISLPSLVKVQQRGIANKCSSLSSVVIATSVVVSLSNSGDPVSGTPIASGTGFIYVPEELVSTYQTATNWSLYSTYFSSMSLEYGFSDICHLAGFSSQYLVTGFSHNGVTVTYPVTSGAAFFSTLDFTPLTASTVPADCEYLYIPTVTAPSVSGITSLKEIYLASSCTALPDNFASGCTALVSVRDEDSLLSIGVGCFSGCLDLTAVEFIHVTSIPASAFSGCSALVDAFLPDVTSVGANAFNSCTSLVTAVFPRSTSVDITAFANCLEINYAPHPSVSALSELDIQAVVIGDSIYRDESLGWLFPPVAGYEWNEAFISLTPVSSITFRNCTSVPTGIYSSTFSDLWLLGSSVASLSDSHVFDGSLITTTGHIHVWRDVIDQYLVATNWSALASRITVITVHDEIDFDFPKEES